jgi:SSS family solute:Na+ symporter
LKIQELLAQAPPAANWAARLPDGKTQLFVIIIYLVTLLFLGFFASRLFRGTKKDYLLASHSIGPILLLMSLFGTTMTAFALVGSSGEAYSQGIGVYGMLASSSGIVHSLCFFVVGIKLWRLGQRHNYSTQIQYFRDRLESDVIGLLLFPILVGLIIPYLLIGVMAAGITIQSLTAGAFPDLAWFQTDSRGTSGGVPPWLGSLVICLVVLCYVFFGGMRGTAWANALQTMVFMILGVVAVVVIANKLGKQDNFLANLQTIGAAIPLDKATRIGMSQTKFMTYLLIPLSVGMFPHLFQHWLTARSAKSFRLTVVCHPIFIMIVWVPCVLIGVWATTDLIPPKPPLPTLPNGVVNQNAILPFLVQTLTDPLLGGFVSIGILAAIMSSLDSQFLCIGSIFSNDIVTHYAGEGRFDDKQQVWIARAFIVMIVAVTYVLSLQGYRSVFAMAIWCFTGFAALFPLVFAALYWKRLTAAGAVAGILAMMGSWIYLFRESNWAGIEDYTIRLEIGDVKYEVMPVVAVLLCSLVAMVITSLITKPPSEKTLAKFF